MAKYGYKVCYKELGKHKLKIHLVTNTYDLALWEVQYFETHKQIDRQTKQVIQNPIWFIKPIKTYLEYKLLWKGCPF